MGKPLEQEEKVRACWFVPVRYGLSSCLPMTPLIYWQ